MLLIDYTQLSKEALQGLMDAFILREGTDYGFEEISHADKVNNLYKQIVAKKVVITFDEDTHETNLLTQQQFKKIQADMLNDGNANE